MMEVWASPRGAAASGPDPSPGGGAPGPGLATRSPLCSSGSRRSIPSSALLMSSTVGHAVARAAVERWSASRRRPKTTGTGIGSDQACSPALVLPPVMMEATLQNLVAKEVE